ncbi:MAG: hypothetical protein KAH22_00490 [Thiotrichaceae bacterium]|nr:hypothetical protein [Thiotrichaceae bacterium]
MIHFQKALLLFILMIPASYADTYPSEILKAADTKANGVYVRAKFVSLMGKRFARSNKKKVLVIGDSHAQDFINMAYENGFFANYQVKTRNVPTHCQVSLVDDHEKYIKAKYRDFCEKADSLQKAIQQIGEADIVILVANWTMWAAKGLPKTIKNLNLAANQKLIVIGRKSFGRINLRKLVKKSKDSLLKFTNRVDSNQEPINRLMRATLNKGIYVDFHKTICQQSRRCRLFTEDLELISFDGGHLTKKGASYVGKQLFEKTLLRGLIH